MHLAGPEVSYVLAKLFPRVERETEEVLASCIVHCIHVTLL